MTPERTSVGSARLSARSVRLKPIERSDYEMLYRAELSEALISRWRHRGATPSPEAWSQNLWLGVLSQFLIVSTRQQEEAVLGMVACIQADAANGHAQLAAASFTGEPGIEVVEGAALFISYVFHNWNFVKLYMDVPGYNLSQIESGLKHVFHEEGRLKGHVFKYGQAWDLHILAVYRDHWKAFGEARGLESIVY